MEVRRKIQLVQSMPTQDQFYRSLFPISNLVSCHNHHHHGCAFVLIILTVTKEDRQAKRYTIQVFLLAVAIASFCIVHFIVILGDHTRQAWCTMAWGNVCSHLLHHGVPFWQQDHTTTCINWNQWSDRKTNKIQGLNVPRCIVHLELSQMVRCLCIFFILGLCSHVRVPTNRKLFGGLTTGEKRSPLIALLRNLLMGTYDSALFQLGTVLMSLSKAAFGTQGTAILGVGFK